MTALSRLFGKLAKLPPAQTHDVIVERDLKVTMSDGVVLLADRHFPHGAERLASATKLIAADQSIYHDPDHPSAVTLAVWQG